ncbi:tyrosine-protein kinase receptor torso-like [Oscarella lobularis]|uniref:tyrosine-protein kinase receptor torso-like n=1 Tax=Oscarella lobularis TaxID=121494 RepID=UPI003313AB39
MPISDRQDSSVPANADLSPSSSRPKLKYPPSTRMSVPVPQLTIIMSVISSVIALIIFGAIVTCIHRKRHRSSTAAFDSIELRNDWEIRRGDLFMLDKIGQGAFGVVLKAQLYCKSLPRSSLHDPDWENKKIVACKMVKGPCQQDSDFMDEIKLMKRIGKHPHIVSMLACITRSQPLCLVVEYCCHGDLLSNLQKGRLELDEDQEVSEHAFKDEENVEGVFTASDLLSFAWQIASGMSQNFQLQEYLAGKGLVHRDLACRNVLVCENNLLKVSDFGLTRAVYQDGVYLQKKARRLPLRWMSIEAITHRIFTEKSDV